MEIKEFEDLINNRITKKIIDENITDDEIKDKIIDEIIKEELDKWESEIDKR